MRYLSIVKFTVSLLLSTCLALSCWAQKAPTAKTPANVEIYRASISVDLGAKERVTVKVWNPDAPGKSLGPWQAYVDFKLTGTGHTILFRCHEKRRFRIREVTQEPAATSGILYDTLGNVGTTLSNPAGVNTITFACYAPPTKE